MDLQHLPNVNWVLMPHSGIIVVFRAKRGDRIKVLLWDGSGLVLCYRRLEQGKFAWPKVQDGVMRLSKGQFEALFEGLDWRRVMARRTAVRVRQNESRHQNGAKLRAFMAAFC